MRTRRAAALGRVATLLLLCRCALTQVVVDSDVETGAIAECVGYIQDEDWKAAQAWCEKAVHEEKADEGSSNVEPYLKLAFVHQKLENFKKATHLLNKVRWRRANHHPRAGPPPQPKKRAME